MCCFMKLYFTAIVLPEELNAEIKLFKNLMFEKWGCKVGLKSPAHVTLIPPFWMNEKWEGNFCTDLELLCKQVAPFVITTADFSAFRPRTIFIEPVLDGDLKGLKQITDAFCNTHTQYGARADNRPFHPHITIATRDLHKSAFAEAWSYFETKNYRNQFEATGLSLLRHNTKHWDVIFTAPFTGSKQEI